MTVTLDEEVARWARIRAAERDTSVSRLIGDLLREKMVSEHEYDAAMREYLARPARALRKPKARYPRRDDLHAR